MFILHDASTTNVAVLKLYSFINHHNKVPHEVSYLSPQVSVPVVVNLFYLGHPLKPFSFTSVSFAAELSSRHILQSLSSYLSSQGTVCLFLIIVCVLLSSACDYH